MVKDKSWSGRIFEAVNSTILVLASLVSIIPFIYVIAVSFTSPHEVAKGGLILFPREWSLAAYQYIFSTNTLLRSLLLTVYVTVVGTLINLFMTSVMAYPLSRRRLRGRQGFMMLVLFTMLFSGGMIPTYFIVKYMGLTNTLWSLMIPTAISAFNLIVLRNFFQNIPEELEESAKIDGASDPVVFARIVIPLSGPAMATFALFYAVDHWNTFFSAVLYINDNTKWPLQVYLREIVILAQSRIGDASFEESQIQPLTIRMAVVVFATIPILCVYPFLQKHFAKGVMMGSVKG